MPLDPNDPTPVAVSSTGTALVVLMLLAQMPAVWKVIRVTKSVEGMSASPSAGMLANFVAWTLYGIVQGDPSVLRVNAIGVGFAIFYLGVFLYYAKNTDKNSQRTEVRKLVFWLVLGLAAVEIPLVAALSGDARILALGSVCVAFCAVMYAAPILAIRYALQKMDVSHLPVLLIIVNAAHGACWTAYGLLVDNQFITGPNAAGALLNTAQLAVYGYICVRLSMQKSALQVTDKKEVAADLEGVQVDSEPAADVKNDSTDVQVCVAEKQPGLRVECQKACASVSDGTHTVPDSPQLHVAGQV